MKWPYRRKWNHKIWKRTTEVKRPKKIDERSQQKPMCKICGKFPIPKGNRIMCNYCLRHANDIYFDESELNLSSTGGKND